MIVIAIHQPNYMPWLGYFFKLSMANVFMFLDDVQFSKNNYINRVQVLGPNGVKWLTIPVKYDFGDPINKVSIVKTDWQDQHLSILENYYRTAVSFKEIWPSIVTIYENAPSLNLATVNRYLIEAMALRLGFDCRFLASSSFGLSKHKSDDRLVRLVLEVDQNGEYLSGRGGHTYQDPKKFLHAGLGLSYTDFEHPNYDQYQQGFVPGLSILDAILHLGWEATSRLILRAGKTIKYQLSR